jgi:hypothetical protein
MGKAKNPKQRLNPRSKVRLLSSWLHYLYKETESWAEHEFGMHIAYLVKAVIHNERVEWQDNNPVLKLILKKDPKRKAEIWSFIVLVPGD